MSEISLYKCDILIVLNSLVAEGCPQLSLNLACYWKSKGLNVELICIDKFPNDLLKEFNQNNIKINFYNPLSRGLIRYFNLVFFTFKVCKKLKPKAILCFPFGWHFFVSLGAKLANVKNICTHIGNYPPLNDGSMFKFKLLVQLGRLFTRKCICCSDYIMEASIKYFLLPRKSLCRVYNCCDIEKFDKFINKKYFSNDKNLHLGMVARLEKHKDQSTLIKAIPEILKYDLKVRVSIIGDGSRRQFLEKLVKNLGVESMVNFLGSRRDIPELLSELDVFVFSAKVDEGFGIALAEAMVSGVPILASNVGACTEILCNGKYGYLFEESNPKDLARKIIFMNKYSKDVNRKVEGAKKYSRENFSIEKMANSYLKYLIL
tara:strand:+ start:12899 stop:14023 length:1125 start_codon:yes stop_codon:yes gene_type:complete